MSRNKKIAEKSEKELEKLKTEVARELNLEDDIKKRGWENLTARETGKIGGHMVKKLMRKAREDMHKKES
ncbi:Small, acid-soluble spore protein, alpha/beta type [Caldanaerovirga acetigignens]|uniref:Small, acid-soluble spore protein, alpha/beta type n=1 Tax=Caldanaerovirga acetigignens TaxID=447595 RepID=A0A1M7G6W3_9FIRM|nr:alpha/beta-type small acid-soluble spore protein [Caldanaerovirga acetigignens]SHM11589.1 Small, acid-soluble spore protein, alpha/beta type [Caldanaerovirga acetigignens]